MDSPLPRAVLGVAERGAGLPGRPPVGSSRSPCGFPPRREELRHRERVPCGARFRVLAALTFAGGGVAAHAASEASSQVNTPPPSALGALPSSQSASELPAEDPCSPAPVPPPASPSPGSPVSSPFSPPSPAGGLAGRLEWCPPPFAWDLPPLPCDLPVLPEPVQGCSPCPAVECVHAAPCALCARAPACAEKTSASASTAAVRIAARATVRVEVAAVMGRYPGAGVSVGRVGAGGSVRRSVPIVHTHPRRERTRRAWTRCGAGHAGRRPRRGAQRAGRRPRHGAGRAGPASEAWSGFRGARGIPWSRGLDSPGR